MDSMDVNQNSNRRTFCKSAARWLAASTLIGAAGMLEMRRQKASGANAGETVWQIDPHLCIACGACAVECVKLQSAVKCFHRFDMCGYCDLCTGFFDPQPLARNTGAENQLCPTGAIRRRFVEEPYYEYTIDEELCVGCGKCVEGCVSLGNGSLYLQINQHLCDQCHECAIATCCPAQAIKKISAAELYCSK